MLDGFTPWPPELAQRFRAAGYWEGLTLWDMVARTVARLPGQGGAGGRRAPPDLRRSGPCQRPLGRRAAAPGHSPAGPGGAATAQHARIRRTATWRWCASARFRCWRCARTATPRCGTSSAPPARWPTWCRMWRTTSTTGRWPHRCRQEFAGLARVRGGRGRCRARPRTPPAGRGRRRRRRGDRSHAGHGPLRAHRRGHDAAVGRHHLAVQADPAHARGLRAQRPPVRPRRRASTNTRCSWPSCRWATTTTWPRPASWAPSTSAARWCWHRRTDTTEIFRLVERERVTVIAAVVPLIAAWLGSDVNRSASTMSLAEGGAERRRAAGPGAAPAPDQRAGLHAAGDLRHRRRPDQHDPAGRPAEELLLHSSGRPVCEDDEITVVDDDGRELPDGETGELHDAWALHHPRLLPGAGQEHRGLHRRRLLPHGRHRAQAGPQRLGRRPAQGPDQPWRRENQLRGGRELHPPASGGEVGLPGGHARPGVRREGLRLRDPARGRKPQVRGTDRLPAQPADRQLQAARAAGGGGAVSAQPGGQDPQARNCATRSPRDSMAKAPPECQDAPTPNPKETPS